MISCDTNILFPYCDADSAHHTSARSFLSEMSERDDFCLSEQVLQELYVLVRNPVMCARPLTAAKAVEMIQTFRGNPRWSIVDVVPGSGIMDRVWQDAAQRNFAYRKIFDARLARTLQHHGVTEFATRNIRDFQSFGFKRVWDPI